ncbi:MAG: hypothetical protein HGB35_00010 [Geobacteraceae bacterium]|nr:hypothetical protein [Geobacteraceae bacterium]
MIPIVGELIAGGIDLAKGLIEGTKAKQAKKLEIDLQMMEHKAEIEKAEQAATTSYDLAALQQQGVSWKDEYLMILLSLPFIGSFVPVVQDYVVKGWEYVGKAPLWFQSSFIGVIAATFGLRWLFSRSVNIPSSTDRQSS